MLSIDNPFSYSPTVAPQIFGLTTLFVLQQCKDDPTINFEYQIPVATQPGGGETFLAVSMKSNHLYFYKTMNSIV